ncbi:MAG: toxin-activating lysine-acyltransferase [Burkholderiales bacterium]
MSTNGSRNKPGKHSPANKLGVKTVEPIPATNLSITADPSPDSATDTASTKASATSAANASKTTTQPPKPNKTALAKLTHVGPIIWLMNHIPSQRHHFYIDIDWHIMPPLILNQAKLFMKEGVPRAYVSWALVNDDIQQRLAQGDTRLAPREWKCGNNLWLIDLVTPFGSPEAVIKELREQIFPTQSIKAVLLNPKTGKLQRVEWPAVNPASH